MPKVIDLKSNGKRTHLRHRAVDQERMLGPAARIYMKFLVLILNKYSVAD